ncbi:MAG: hypothetical protein U0271_05090 [Polyangiaceae bacterium]
MDTLGTFEQLQIAMEEVRELSKFQTGTRDGIITVINELCDTLALACNLVVREIGSTLVDYQAARGSTDRTRDFVGATAKRFSNDALRALLKEGRVCGPLHMLGDRLRQPFSSETSAAVPFWEALRAIFTRSTTMSNVIHGLHEGERQYLCDIENLLHEVQARAEQGLSPHADPNSAAEGLALLLRHKRDVLRVSSRSLRDAADACIAALA